MPAAWLSLDPGDNQEWRFLHYVMAALRTVNPAIGSDAARLPGGRQQASPLDVMTGIVNDLNADSLDTVELVMELEDEFDMTIPDDQAEKLRTVGEAIDFIKKQLAVKS